MNKDEASRNAIDIQAKYNKEHAEKQGRYITDEQARKAAVIVAERVEKKESK